jgi:hypothetical protein
MTVETAWLDNSGDAGPRYDFYPPKQWPEEHIAAEQAAIAALIDRGEGGAVAPGWLQLAARLPPALRAALVAELRAGNRLTGIGSTGWPGAGSIVVTMRERFTVARDTPPAGVVWRRLDDPHYAREELSARADTVEHLVIT